MADLSLSGLASGFDWKTVVDQLTDLDRSPQTRLRTEQTSLNKRNDLLTSLNGLLTTLKDRAKAVADTALYDSRIARSSDANTSASAASGAASGNYQFSIYQLASPASQLGGTDAGAAASSSGVLNDSGFGIPATAGTFTINGKQVAIDPVADSLTALISRINSTSGIGVTASLATDKITLTSTSSSTIVMGSSTDTSNFLSAARLTNNGTSTITSSSNLGGLRLSSLVNAANFSGGAAASSGSFKINGVTVSYTSASTVRDVVQSINSSAGGVTANYDSINDRFTLVNKTDGDVGISLEDLTGDFLAKTKLLAANGGGLQRGKNMLYRVNDGAVLSSQSNVASDSSHGITGLSVTATKANGASKINGISSNVVTTAATHGYSTGNAVSLHSLGTVPSGLSTSATYYTRVLSATSYSLHNTESDAASGASAVTISSSGTGDNFFLGANPVSANINVASDSAKIKTAITSYVDQYNKVQAMIDSNTASTTDSKGKVTQGPLANDRVVLEFSTSIRAKTSGDATGVTGAYKRMEALGFRGSGYNNQLTLSDPGALDSALVNNITDIKTLFTKTTDGLGNSLNTYLEGVSNDVTGTLLNARTSLTTQSKSIDTQIADMERRVQSSRQRLINSFVAMEQAQAKINQQMQYLSKNFQ